MSRRAASPTRSAAHAESSAPLLQPTSVFLLLLGLILAAPAAGQTVTVMGVVEDDRSGRPIGDAVVTVVGTAHTALTDPRGGFRITSIPPGSYMLRVAHVGYGEQSVRITVEVEMGPVRLKLSESAVALEPLTVDVLSSDELRARGAGFRRSMVTRDQIALAENTNMTLPEVLRQYVPSVRVRRNERLVGSDVCIELRTIRGTNGPSCLSPAVYLDGVPVTNPTSLYSTLDPNMVESMEVVPAAEAGTRFGTGALYGALLIETRRPGTGRGDRNVDPPKAFDWSQDERSHPLLRSFIYGFVGNAAGLAVGLAAANQCIGTRAPARDRIITHCDTWPTFGAGAAALFLPALGAGFGSGVGGRTDLSSGRLLPAAVGGAMALVPGYALLITSQRSDSDALRFLGTAIVAVGAPLVTTLSDHLFRRLRNDGTR
jgi:hypothetical protein